MTTLRSLATAQKLTKADILPLFCKLGFQLPHVTRKDDLLESLEVNIAKEDDSCREVLQAAKETIFSLDMGLKNMSMARFCLHGHQKVPTLYQWFKMDLDQTECTFNPINYSNITLDFLYDHIINDKLNKAESPVSVILERQRFRTAGSSAVLESTLKTNTLEAMLCMGIVTHNRSRGKNGTEINTVSSPPGAMVKYWHRLFRTNEKASEKESKLFRVELVLNLLLLTLERLQLNPKNVKEHALRNTFVEMKGTKPKFMLSEQLVYGLSTFLASSEGNKRWDAAWSFKSQSRRLWEVVRIINEANDEDFRVSDEVWGVKKGDDLADSLLHGIAYFEYQENRRKFQCLIHEGGDIRKFSSV